MAAKTPTARGTTGYVGNGVYGGVATTTNNLLSDVATHFPDRSGFALSIFHFSDIDNLDTWTSEIKNAFACAWQAEDGADDCCSVAITSYTTAQSRARGGAVFTFQAENSDSAGWLWVLHGS